MEKRDKKLVTVDFTFRGQRFEIHDEHLAPVISDLVRENQHLGEALTRAKDDLKELAEKSKNLLLEKSFQYHASISTTKLPSLAKDLFEKSKNALMRWGDGT